MSEDEIVEFPSWSEAVLNSTGYTDSLLAQALGSQYEKFLISSNSNQLDIRFSSRRLHLVSGYLIACLEINSPQVADVGGGNGYMFDWIKATDSKKSINFTVFESGAISSIYQALKKDSRLNFLNISEFSNFPSVDLVIISGTLQYLADWEEILVTALKKSKYVLVLRTPIIDEGEHKIFVQTPPDGVYADAKASWPVRFFSRTKFLSLIEQYSKVVFSALDSEEGFFYGGSLITLESFLLCSKLTTYDFKA